MPRRINIHFTPRWLSSMEQLLAMCEGEGIDPRIYIESIAETMGWWAVNNKMTLQPSHCIGRGAVDRYHRWLSRQHASQHRADIGQGQKADKKLEAERTLVEAYAILQGVPPRKAHASVFMRRQGG